jgi:putative FmdB family regulatory protein
MPVFEYTCSKCGYEFEELHLSSKAAEKHKTRFPCPECGRPAIRIPSATNFSFVETTPGNSGVHQHDYPDADRAVGSSAEKKWAKYYQEQDEKNKARKKHKTNALKKVGDEYVPLSKNELKVRDTALKTFKKADKSGLVGRETIPIPKQKSVK